MRRNPTEPEKRLWSKLRNRQVGDVKFRRQVWLVGYIADFYAADIKLVIEVDGDDHAVREAADQQRSRILQREGFRIIRFANADIMDNIEAVLEAILMAARSTPSPSQAFGSGPSLSPVGERGQ
jgi:very-short-patch-repair endonuclease